MGINPVLYHRTNNSQVASFVTVKDIALLIVVTRQQSLKCKTCGRLGHKAVDCKNQNNEKSVLSHGRFAKKSGFIFYGQVHRRDVCCS